MTQAASRTSWLVQSHIAAANRPPETMSADDFRALYRQHRIAFYQKRGDHMANPGYLLNQAGEKPADPASYLCDIFAVTRDHVGDAEYTVSLVGDPMQKIVIVHDHP